MIYNSESISYNYQSINQSVYSGKCVVLFYIDIIENSYSQDPWTTPRVL